MRQKDLFYGSVLLQTDGNVPQADLPPAYSTPEASPPVTTRFERSTSPQLACTYPLVSIVGMDHIKEGLILTAVDHNLGGIIISGRRGTAKTIAARGLHSLLPPIEVVQGSFCNADPSNPSEWEDSLYESVSALPNIPTYVRDAPFVQIPLGVTEDRLVGSVDVEASVKAGYPVFQPGLLAEAHRGILYVDEINLLDEGIVNLLLNILSEGVNIVEREGISVSHPCQPLLIATYNPEEGALREHLLDRIAITLSSDVPLPFERRVQAVEAATRFQNHRNSVLEESEEATNELRNRILFAREFLPNVIITQPQVRYLVQEAVRGGVVGHRAEIFAARVAKAAAALAGREYVTAPDLQIAVKLVILPRCIITDLPQQQPPLPPKPRTEEQEEESEKSREESEREEENNQDEVPDEIPEEFMFDAQGVLLDPSVLMFAKHQKRSRGRSGRAKSGLIYSEERGRYVKSMFPKGNKVKRLAVDATLRAAAPYQKSRRSRMQEFASSSTKKKVFIDKSDLRSKRLARKAGALVIFVVDASGSMALNRMASAKGAILRLLAESYTSRDFVCLIPFHGNQAHILLPPSRSILMAERRLENLPCGGGTPLAHALSLAIRTGVQSVKSKSVGRVMVVLVTDGRVNVPLAKSTLNDDASRVPGIDVTKASQEDMRGEVIDMAKKLGALGLHLLVIDTESKYVSSGFSQEIAKAARGKYYYLPNATDKALNVATSLAMKEAKQD